MRCNSLMIEFQALCRSEGEAPGVTEHAAEAPLPSTQFESASSWHVKYAAYFIRRHAEMAEAARVHCRSAFRSWRRH